MLRTIALVLSGVMPLIAQIAIQAPGKVKAGQQVTISYADPSDAKDFISIVPKNKPEGMYDAYAYTRNGKPVELRAPEVPGEYEIRYLAAQGPYKTLARSALTVTAVSATLHPPATVAAGAELAVAWEGPNNQRDFITLVKKGGSPRAGRGGERPRTGDGGRNGGRRGDESTCRELFGSDEGPGSSSDRTSNG